MDKGKYTFFHHLASYMKDMEDIREEDKEGEAKAKIISTIAQNEMQYARVCIFHHIFISFKNSSSLRH